MQIKVGDFILVKTKTAGDIMGDCVYEVRAVPNNDKKVQCVMLGGSGSMARHGIKVYDTLEALNKNAKQGTVVVLEPNRAKRIAETYNDKNEGKPGPGGIVEM